MTSSMTPSPVTSLETFVCFGNGLEICSPHPATVFGDVVGDVIVGDVIVGGVIDDVTFRQARRAFLVLLRSGKKPPTVD